MSLLTRQQHVKCLVSVYAFCICAVITFIIYLEKLPNHIDVVLAEPRPLTLLEGLLDLPNFSYTLNSDGCPSNISVALIVTSYAGDVETRSSFRQAYPQSLLSTLGVKRVFLLALMHPEKEPEMTQEALSDENSRFGDIVQGNFIENYRNLTYKHVMGLRWAVENCFNVKYVIKMDHDIVVDFFSIIKMLRKLPERDNILAGYVMSHMKPIREPANKWYVKYDEYGGDSYPDFLSGWLYITNPLTARLLCSGAEREPYFWIDDTFITGIVASKFSIPLVRLNSFYTTHPEHLYCCIEQPDLECDFWIGPNGGDNRLVRNYEKFAEHCFRHLCRRRLDKESVRNNCTVKF